MWLVMKVLWKSFARVLRRFGWGALLVPAAAVGVALFGVHLWTVAMVVLALVLAVCRPVVTASLAPVAMVAAGISGLAAASAMPGSPVEWLVSPVSGFSGKQMSIRISSQSKPGLVPPPPPPPWSTGGIAAQVVGHKGMGKVVGPPSAGKHFVVTRVITGPPHSMHPFGWWHGRLLVPVALLLLALGLWLAPRTITGLADRAATLSERLRQHMRENRWGVLLVPVALIGVTVFGVRPWTVGIVAAAVIVVIKWPEVAADLVPVAPAAFALYGFEIAARWQAAAT